MDPWVVSKNQYRNGKVLNILNSEENMEELFIQTFLHAVELFDRVLNKLERVERATGKVLLEEHVNNIFNTCLYLANVIAEFRMFSTLIDNKMKGMIITRYINFVIKTLQGDIFALKEGLVTEVMREGRHEVFDIMVNFKRYPILGLDEAANANNAIDEIGQLSRLNKSNTGGSRKRRSKSAGKASRRRRSR
jgi:hypothetical protein